MRKALVLWPAAVLLAAGGAYGAWLAWAAPQERADALPSALVQRADVLDTVAATGTLQPRDYVDVGTQVSGQLRTLHVEVGERVAKGALLAEIDPTVYRAKVEASEAQLRNLQAQLAQRQAQLTLAEQRAERQARLAREQATTAEAVQSAQAELQSSRAQIQALQAQIQQTRSTLRGDQAALGYTRIHAPMAGTVVVQHAKQGQTLNANQSAPVVLRIADLSVMTVQTQVSEADVSRLSIGMPVYFTTLGSQGKRWHGTLRQINPTPEVQNNVVLYNALFDVPNPDGALMTQMTSQVFFVVAEAKDAVVVPVTALEGARVRVLGADGRVETRAVELGVRNRVAAEVRAGLEPGERVLLNNERLRSDSERRRTAGSASATPVPPFLRGPRL
ncbi:MAG TPA: efflux RND transporter periplasmic adaptor subunit [Burkholderiales bacterium]|nr:efflux RND transporter periplasmic adaptor subunit [Burkholderiales bacterium]